MIYCVSMYCLHPPPPRFLLLIRGTLALATVAEMGHHFGPHSDSQGHAPGVDYVGFGGRRRVRPVFKLTDGENEGKKKDAWSNQFV